MNHLSRSVIAAALVGLIAPPTAQAQWYLGVGTGDANVDSDTTPPTVVRGSDGFIRSNDDLPWKLVVGHTAEPLSVEVLLAHFGDLYLDPDGVLERRVTGVVGRKQLLGSVCDATRAYDLSASLGVGHVRSRYEGVAARQDASAALIGGLSASMQLGDEVALRADYDYFDSDTQLTTVSLVMHLGDITHCERTAPSVQPVLAPVTATPTNPAVTEDATAPTPAEPTRAASAGTGQLPDILFNPDSTFLTDAAVAQIDRLARLLAAYPTMVVELQGHSDGAEWGGSALGLSAERARRVATGLAQRGVDRARLQLAGYADSRPVASNGGTALNRRVQFRIVSLR
ncbi:MAG: OmpA family protein [Pseudomonadota bacterium]